MKILITGGAGFIGSHLCDFLLDKKHQLTCVDNLITGRLKNINHLLKNSNFKFIKMDVSSDKFKKFSNRIEAIFHFASPASPVDYQNYPLRTLITNSIGTLAALEIAKKNKAKFLLASTSEVYGEPKIHPQPETYWGNVNPVGIRSCYDESKRFSETLSITYFRKFSLDLRIVRIFNTYGPRLRTDDGRVISNFISQAIQKKPLTVYGSGKQTRSFCYISDMTDGIIKAMFTKKTQGEIINLGNAEEIQIIKVARLIQKKFPYKIKISFSSLPEDDPTKRRPDISKANKLLGWQPKVSLDEGLNKTIIYFKKEIT
jgi:nucleoside-diphosphate-sugar epimerase